MEVRDALPSDCENISRLHAETFPEGPWKAAFFEAACRSESHLLLVVQTDDRLLGFALAAVVTTQVEILSFAISSPLRRRGLGTALLNAIEQRGAALGARHCLLDVSAKNVNATRLYQASGYTQDGRRPDYYGAGEDAVLMSKILI